MNYSSTCWPFAFAFVLASTAFAQPNNNPCNDGRVGPPRTDPRSSGMHCMRPWGMMQGWLTCAHPNVQEDYGSNIVALGDINHDNIADFAVEHTRCDTLNAAAGNVPPTEWYVFHGVKGGVPNSRGGQRIGPREIDAETRILCSGDWDADGNRDIAVKIRVYGDTSNGNTRGLGTQHVVVFWGTRSGQFSIDDTSRLSCGTAMWFDANRGISFDADQDGVDDLCVWSAFGEGFSAGQVVPCPKLFMFRGHRNGRWNREGLRSGADWYWWSPPPMNYLKVVDQDCDGHPDIALINQDRSNIASDVSVLYGRARALPDTNEVETVNLTAADGHYTLFMDVTGDHVPEMVSNSDSEVIRVFAGRPGQRLRAQYGTGNEQGKPWLNIDLPKRVNPRDWFSSGEEPLYDLGDGDGDGTSDVWTYSFPFFVQYATSFYFDRFIDAGMWWGPRSGVARLGDIDGSGLATIAVGWYGTLGGLAFYHVGDSLRLIGELIDLPHPEDFKCEATATVTMPPSSKDDAVALDVVPNPSRGEMAVTWRVRGRDDGATISLVDAAGTEVLRRAVPANVATTTISTTGIAPGFYLLILRCGIRSTAVKVFIDS